MPDNYLSRLRTNLESINNAIKSACQQANRNTNDICLVAVSKGQGFDKIKAAYDLGLRDFGENYAQEFIFKKKEADKAGLSDIKWHFIGGIQSNKIKLIAQANVVHSIGSIDHAKTLNKAVMSALPIFLQVNLGATTERQGFLPRELAAAQQALGGCENLKLLGLMSILPLSPQKDSVYWFNEMAQLRDNVSPVLKLSMGMSQDFSQAIIAGSNYIRIGEKLFGPRGDKLA